jgi:hypothetical protein
MPGFSNPWVGRGLGRGSGFNYGMGFGGGGFGRGWRNRFFAAGGRGRGWGRGNQLGWDQGYFPGYGQSPYYDDERAALKEEADYLRSALDNINRRLDEIQGSKKEE